MTVTTLAGPARSHQVNGLELVVYWAKSEPSYGLGYESQADSEPGRLPQARVDDFSLNYSLKQSVYDIRFLPICNDVIHWPQSL